MFRFIRNVFVVATSCFSCNALKCVPSNNQECKVGPEIININSNESSFHPYSVKISKCSGSCKNINDPYTKLCVLDAVKNMNVRVFNLIPRTKETRYIERPETCKCKCRLDVSICNNKQRWNKDTRRCQCKELIDKGICDKGFIWNPSNRECECDKSCDAGEYLDYKNCKCKKRQVEKLVEEYSENIDRNKMIHNGTFSNYRNVYACLVQYIFYYLPDFS